MAIQYCCDFCGEPIDDDGELRVELKVSGLTYDPERGVKALHSYNTDPLGHYHATLDRPCWAEMVDRIQLIHAVQSDLGPDRTAIERRIDRRAETGRHRAEMAERERDHREREHAWRRLSQERRDELLLRGLGEEGLTIREWTARLNAELGSPTPEEGWPTVHPSTVTKMAKRMVATGDLKRVGERFKGNTRYRYFRAHQVTEAVA